MAKIPFSLEAWLKDKSQKVETRDGRPSRILCWDRRGERSLVVLVQQPLGYDDVLYYYESGLADGIGRESDEDLFIVTPEPEMSEMEILLLSWLSHDTSGRTPTEWMKQEVKARATKLLALAREELFANDAVLKEYAEVAREQGKAEALKDLPRWKKATGKERFNERMIVLAGDNDLFCTNCAEEGEYYLPFPILEKLPKEDESHE